MQPRIPEGEAIGKMSDARRYNQAMGNRIMLRQYRELAHDVVETGIPQGGHVLDVGTGPGFVAIEVARLLHDNDCQVTGLDMSDAMLTVAAENSQREGLNGTLGWQKGDAGQIPFPDASFDCVVTSGSLHHWENPVRVFDEIARVLKPGGSYVINDLKRQQCWGERLFSRAIGLSIPPDFRVHFHNSIRAAYTREELATMLADSRLPNWRIHEDFMGLQVTGKV
jgi:ubiquinone/menaquinone biosynthesis C-methylase UbiE